MAFAEIRAFIRRYDNRVLFGTDMVVTKHKRKTVQWLTEIVQCYRHMLEAQRHRCSLVEGSLNGLALDEETLRQIYEVNPQSILRAKED